MNLDLARAFRLLPFPSIRETSPKISQSIEQRSDIAFVGAGGKTTALFQLAHQLAPAVITTTTHLGAWQARSADRHFILGADNLVAIESDFLSGVTLVTGPVEGERLTALDETTLDQLHTLCIRHNLPLLVEADGAKSRALKAPAEYEPAIPGFVNLVVVVAGISALDQPLTDKIVHRPEIFSQLGGLKMDEPISSAALTRVLVHPDGGLKGIPHGAHRVVLLNQADTPDLQAEGKAMAAGLLSDFSAVIIASAEQSKVHAVLEPTGAIILAAGGSKRFGSPKQLLDWHGKPFICQVAETALAAGLSPVIVVTGANSESVDSAICGLPLTVIHNPDWQSGQASSIKAGLKGDHLNDVGSAIFLLSDQPQVTISVLQELVKTHSSSLDPIVAPQVAGQRTNPVLFDRVTFPDLMSLTGDVGGRAIFSKYPVTYLPWEDERLLFDIDTPDDYQELIGN